MIFWCRSGGLRTYRVLVDGVERGRLDPGEELLVVVPAGRHTVSATMRWPVGGHAVTVDADPSTSVSVRVEPATLQRFDWRRPWGVSTGVQVSIDGPGAGDRPALAVPWRAALFAPLGLIAAPGAVLTVLQVRWPLLDMAPGLLGVALVMLLADWVSARARHHRWAVLAAVLVLCCVTVTVLSALATVVANPGRFTIAFTAAAWSACVAFAAVSRLPQR